MLHLHEHANVLHDLSFSMRPNHPKGFSAWQLDKEFRATKGERPYLTFEWPMRRRLECQILDTPFGAESSSVLRFSARRVTCNRTNVQTKCLSIRATMYPTTPPIHFDMGHNFRPAATWHQSHNPESGAYSLAEVPSIAAGALRLAR